MTEASITLSDDRRLATVKLQADSAVELSADAVVDLIRQLIVARAQMEPRPPNEDPPHHVTYLPAERIFAGRDRTGPDPAIHVLLLIPGLGWTGVRMEGPAMRDMLGHID